MSGRGLSAKALAQKAKETKETKVKKEKRVESDEEEEEDPQPKMTKKSMLSSKKVKREEPESDEEMIEAEEAPKKKASASSSKKDSKKEVKKESSGKRKVKQEEPESEEEEEEEKPKKSSKSKISSKKVKKEESEDEEEEEEEEEEEKPKKKTAKKSAKAEPKKKTASKAKGDASKKRKRTTEKAPEKPLSEEKQILKKLKVDEEKEEREIEEKRNEFMEQLRKIVDETEEIKKKSPKDAAGRPILDKDHRVYQMPQDLSEEERRAIVGEKTIQEIFPIKAFRQCMQVVIDEHNEERMEGEKAIGSVEGEALNMIRSYCISCFLTLVNATSKQIVARGGKKLTEEQMVIAGYVLFSKFENQLNIFRKKDQHADESGEVHDWSNRVLSDPTSMVAENMEIWKKLGKEQREAKIEELREVIQTKEKLLEAYAKCVEDGTHPYSGKALSEKGIERLRTEVNEILPASIEFISKKIKNLEEHEANEQRKKEEQELKKNDPIAYNKMMVARLFSRARAQYGDDLVKSVSVKVK